MEIVIATFIIAVGMYALIIGLAYAALGAMALFLKYTEGKYGAPVSDRKLSHTR